MSEPMLIGGLIRQMLADSRIQALINDYGMMGLGTYVYLRNTIEAQSPGGLPSDYLIKAASAHTSRNRIRSILCNYGLFSHDDFGLVHVCELESSHGTHAHATRTHGTPAHGMHVHTEENNNMNKLSDTDKSVVIKRRFQKPSVEEVDAYCRQRRNRVDANRFCNFYESKGWMVGKSKMVDWKAAVRTWERNSGNANPNPGPHSEEPVAIAPDYAAQQIPDWAPPRPSPTAQWDFATDSWNDFY